MLRHPSSLLRHAVLGAVLAFAPLTLQSTPAAAQVPQFLASWPCEGCTGLTVDPTGAIFAVGGNQVMRFSSDGSLANSWTLPLAPWGRESRAFDVAADRLGHVFVVDLGAQLIYRYSGSGTLQLQWGMGGIQFQGAIALACDASNNVYVGEVGSRIQKFTADSAFVMSWGSRGTNLGELDQVLGLAVAPGGTVYVVEWGNRRVQAFTPTGTPLFMWGSLGTGDGQFSQPTRVAVDHAGTVYVADSDNHRVQIFGATGTYLGQFGTLGSGEGQFNYPHGLAIDLDGNLLVADLNNNRIQKFGYTVVPARASTWGSLKSLHH